MTADGEPGTYQVGASLWTLPSVAVKPAGVITPGVCRSCGAAIAWLRTRATGALSPFNHDGLSHFASCPQAASWRHR